MRSITGRECLDGPNGYYFHTEGPETWSCYIKCIGLDDTEKQAVRLNVHIYTITLIVIILTYL